MLGIKSQNIFVITLAVLTIIVLGAYLFKNTEPGQLKQNLFRFMVGQETYLKTVQFSESQTEHFQFKYLPIDSAYMPLVEESAEEAYQSVTEFMGREPKIKTAIVVFPDSSTLAKSFGWDKDEKAMGVYWGGTIRILSPREWLADSSDKEQFIKEGPMVHEFAHLLVDDMTKGNYNRWWTEGIAQFVEKQITGFEFEEPFLGEKQKSYYSLQELGKNFDQVDQRIAYWQSLKLVEFLVSQYGEENIYSILQYLGTGNSMEQAVALSLNTDYQSFEMAYYNYLEKI
ncbi:MAG: peptidase MA family metallohydrolase [Bacillota bacterium]|nr:peptidase MA family metallohydrolase [Bacillota bacterium]